MRALAGGYHAAVPADCLVILNPQSGGGSAERRFAPLEGRLRDLLGPCELERSAGPRDAERLAREAVRAGVRRIVVAGGDGTLGEAVSGMLAAGPVGDVQLGLLPLGTGLDFARSCGIPRDPARALELLASGKPRPVDAGRIVLRDASGRERRLGFLNVASFGVSGLVVDLVNRGPKLPGSSMLGARLSFLVGTLRALLRFRCRPVKLRVDGKLVFEGPLALCAVANGGWFGGGMHVAPEARLDDGLLEVIVVREMSTAGLVARLPKLYAGSHLGDSAVVSFRGRVVEAEAAPGEIPVEVDGDPLGLLPARVEVVPGALSFLGPSQ